MILIGGKSLHKYILAVICLFFLSFWIGCVSVGGWSGSYRYVYREHNIEAPIRRIQIWVDKDFSDNDVVEIKRAVDQWNFALNGYVELVVVDTHFQMEIDKLEAQEESDGWIIWKTNSEDPHIPPQDEKGYWTIGWANLVGGNYIYIIRDRVQDDQMFGLSMHEIGHLLGSPHVGTRLMYPHYQDDRYACVDFQTMKAVSKYWGIPAHRMNYCVAEDSTEHSSD